MSRLFEEITNTSLQNPVSAELLLSFKFCDTWLTELELKEDSYNNLTS